MAAEESKALVHRVLAAVRYGWTPAVIDQFFAAGYRRHLWRMADSPRSGAASTRSICCGSSAAMCECKT